MSDLISQRDDAVNAFLDSLAHPDGRCVAKAWDRVTLLYGRSGDVMMRAAFEQYLDELAVAGPEVQAERTQGGNG